MLHTLASVFGFLLCEGFSSRFASVIGRFPVLLSAEEEEDAIVVLLKEL